MRSLIKSILVPVAVLGLAVGFMQACSGDTDGGSSGVGTCVPGETKQCFCDNQTQGVQTCQGDGTYDACPCNSSSSASSSGSGGGGSMGCVPGGSPTVLCGNGTIDPGEQCDDGNCIPNDACTDQCKTPICGDKIVQTGEDCDDGQNEVGDMCPDDCKLDGGTDANNCASQLIFSGLSPTMTIGQWSYQGKLGYEAGTDICKAQGGFGVCDYTQIKTILDDPAGHPIDMAKLAAAVPVGQSVTAWIHRTTPEMVNGMMSAPGPGGRCNDWVYPTSHIADGEFWTFTNNAGTVTGTPTLDPDTVFTGIPDGSHQNPGIDCSPMRYIPCCFKICTP